MVLPLPLERPWHKRRMYRPVRRELTIDDEGEMLGVTKLATFDNEALVFREARVLALLSVACGYPVAVSCLDNIRRAEKCYKRREIVLANMELALIGAHGLDSIEQAQRLFMAEWLMDQGEPPHMVLKYAGIMKYNPHHLGPGPGGGQFTTAGRNGTSNGMPEGAGRRDSSLTLRPSTSRAGEVQMAADNTVASDADSPFPSEQGRPAILPDTVLLPIFPTEDIAAAVIGSGNWIRELFQAINDHSSSTNSSEPDTAPSNGTLVDGSNNVAQENLTQPLERDWTLGDFKSLTKWENQMADRGWTPEQIDDILANGEQFNAPNKVYPQNSATRYIDLNTGRYIVRDDVTGEILQISKDGFKPNE